ncbi:unnamed protein product [Oppiella nova]|uniref:N-acetyltransferase domain-containing protein n=1 Tax=Oppiella nova TaxID=334625 RepID=A0A7R9QPU7_9ACAR|nr:unnamed protein product [Oppiella nova]CAG2170590.1 unnamed protein product [Oppiella nova]
MPIQTKRYRIRHLRKHEISQLLQLCQKEGRHMGTAEEVQSWLQFDPKGFYVAVDEDGVILGSCCGIRLSGSRGYLGMYVVSAQWRGIGIGKQIWNSAIQHLGSRNLGLSAVADLFQLYRDKAGFGHVADWTVDLYRLENMPKLYQYLSQDHHHRCHPSEVIDSVDGPPGADCQPMYQLTYDLNECCRVSISRKFRCF